MDRFDPNIENRYQQMLGDDPRSAIELLFKAYYEPLVHIVYRYTRKQDVAEDLVQDVFYDFWKKRDDIHIHRSIYSYLKRAAINKTLNHFRDNRIETTNWEDYQDLRSTPAQPQRKLEARELEIFLENVITGLPHRCRMVFLLSREEHLSYKEIADELDISVKTVENQISKALKTIRTALSKRWPDSHFAFWLTFLANILPI